ncbi:hypothetical protein [Thiocystis violascens]|uniref:Uncharacterized protein n=1 Tax=Thiocystis violascens (strain ATCC 17096 / DSM 198 / 6111) TaxID=765911 RepID=I3YC62_THIV6|nr:hypothetical protein [Thiocystis violascens]AFL74580.1 hypothetical protein Thivi_2659 [Thiocystis violascens DSM 198]
MNKKALPAILSRIKKLAVPKPLPILLERQDELTARLDDLQRRHAAESEALRQAQADLRTARAVEIQTTETARARRCGALEKNDDGHLTPDAESECARRVAEVPELQEARLSLRRAQSRVDESEVRLKAIADEHEAVDRERYALKDACEGATLDELIALQNRLAAARAEVSSLTERLDTLNAVPVAALPDLTATDAALAAALAKVELGEAEPGILPALERQRETAIQAHDLAKAEQARAELLRQGLASRLNAATAEAERLKAGHKLALAWHLEAELNRTANAYRETAERLFDLRGRLIGMGRVLQYRVDHDAGRRLGIERPTYDSALGACLVVPDASLPALAGMDSLQDNRRFREAAHEAELNRLRQAGVEV